MKQKMIFKAVAGLSGLALLLGACSASVTVPPTAPATPSATNIAVTETSVPAATSTPSPSETPNPDPNYWLHRQNPVGWLGWSADSKTLAASAASGVYLFPTHGNPAAHLLIDEGFLYPSALDFQGKRLIAGDNVWDITTGQLLYKLSQTDISSVAFSPDGSKLALRGDKSISVLDAASGKVLNSVIVGQEQDQYMQGVAFSADGKAVYAVFDHKVRQVDLSTWKSVVLFSMPDDSCCTVFSPDGQQMLVSRPGHGAGSKELWNIEKGGVLQSLGNCDNDTTLEVFSQDGGQFVIGPCGGAQLWDTRAQKFLHLISNPAMQGFYPEWRSAAFNPDGSRIALGNDLGQIMIWDLSSYELLATLNLPLPATPLVP